MALWVSSPAALFISRIWGSPKSWCGDLQLQFCQSNVCLWWASVWDWYLTPQPQGTPSSTRYWLCSPLKHPRAMIWHRWDEYAWRLNFYQIHSTSCRVYRLYAICSRTVYASSVITPVKINFPSLRPQNLISWICPGSALCSLWPQFLMW